ncbi:hypothetical protein [Rugosimonospora africana]|uniref:Secreted protein n=1 Tax=Rugosimonospora africana TaxID=556532 RepID=A0A8J3QSW8_9ACTN|nr:hypothetical protein [Rugosimonospora africana]GIH15038.1 hypothetical protein Raf01_32100 [Rugosimonospora africana]
MSVKRKVFAVVAGAVALTTTTVIATTTASAASAPTSLPANQFTLTADYHRYDALNATLTSTLGTADIDTVMTNAEHTRTAISSPGVAGYSTGFGFDSPDNNDCKNYPQGITSSRDAVGAGSDNLGRYGGHQLILVSWYTMDACDGDQSRSRITLVDWDSSYPNTYRKILLVEPTGTASAPSFTDIPIHAGGVSWYGDYLYVADTGNGMRVFNMKDILKTNTGGTSDQIGRQSSGVYYAHNYGFVLPQIGTISAHTTASNPLVWSSISLDRVSGSIVMVEYTCKSGCTSYPNRAPRAVRFPFSSGATTFAATTTATEALQLPWYQLNGVASHNSRWWFDSSGAKQLYYWTPATGSHTYAWVGGGESISYWEDNTSADLLWSLQETRGHRDVFAVTQATYGP